MFVHGNPSIRIGRTAGVRLGGWRTYAARDLLGDEPNGLAIDFTDNSYAIRTTSQAEIGLDTETGMAIDFVDDSYAMRTTA